MVGIKEPKWGQAVSGTIEEPLGGAERLEVNVDLSISELVIGVQSGEQYAAQGDYTTDSVLEPSVQYDIHGDTGELAITQPDNTWNIPWNWNFENRVTVDLPADIPIDLTVTGDLGGQTLDLAKLDVRSLTVNNNSGQITVILPESAEMDGVDITADLGAITVSSPNETATINVRDLHISNGSGAVTLNLPANGSLGDVNIEADLGAINIAVPRNASLNMRSFYVENSSGAVKVALPASGSLGNVTVKADLGEIVLSVAGDPDGLRIDSLQVGNGSGSVTVTLPDQGDYQATITADLGGITVIVPDALEARAEISTDLGSISVTNSRFREIDKDVWETEGYDDAANRVELDIAADTGGVTVK
jgi:predicted membrane protein